MGHCAAEVIEDGNKREVNWIKLKHERGDACSCSACVEKAGTSNVAARGQSCEEQHECKHCANR